MSSETRMIAATCLCGNAKHAITLPKAKCPLKAYLCHCDSCRHVTGTLCWSVAFLPKMYRPQQPLLDQLQVYQYSKRIELYFCPTCGTTIYARVVANPTDENSVVLWGLSTGTLEQAGGIFEVQGHEHVEDTLDGGFADFLTHLDGKHVARWPGRFEEGEELSLPWISKTKTGTYEPLTDRLYGHCKCGGVQFWIAKPSVRSAQVEAGWPDVLTPYNVDRHLPPKAEQWWLRDNHTKYLGGVCACNSCRLASGCEWVEWAFIPTVDISLDVEGQIPFKFDFGTLREYRSSNQARRYFCAVCSAIAFWDGDDRRSLKDVAVGLLSAPEGARAESWLAWRTERLSFREDAAERAESLTVAVEHGLEQYGRRQAQTA